MSSFETQNFHGLILFIWLGSVLTLSISDEIKKTDGDTNLTSTPDTSHANGNSKIEPKSLSSSSEIANSSTLDKNGATPSVAGEGGPISITPNIKQTSSTSSHLTLDATNLSEKEEDISWSKERKTSKIFSRKGANEDMKKDSTASSNDTRPVIELSTPNDNKKVFINQYNLKSNITNKQRSKIDSTANDTLHSATTMQNNVSVSAVTASSIQEHKPKPTVTVVGPNSDKEAFIPHTKGSHLGMPKKIDYVLPVIVTLVALPVLGAIIFMVYKQGRDCWDKRHYRRMDFLIDGMYND